NDGDSNTPLTTDEENPTRIPLRPGMLSKFADQGTFILEQFQRISESVGELLSPANRQAMVGSIQAIGDSAQQLGAAATRIQEIAEAQLGPKQTDIPGFVSDTRVTMRALQTTAADISTTALAATETAGALSSAIHEITAPGGVLDQLGTASRELAQSAQGI